MDIDVLRPNELTPALQTRWLELQRASEGRDTPFLSPYWARSVEDAKGGRGVRVAVVSEQGEPRAFMPASAGKVTAIAAGGAMCDYEGLVCEPGFAVDPQAVVRALGVSRYDFSHALESDAALAPYGRGAHVSWLIDVPDGYEAYAAARRAEGVSALKEIERKRRKVEREVAAPVFTAWSTARTHFDRMIELKREQFRLTGQTDVFDAGWTLQLVQDLFAMKTPGFGGALFTLHFGDRLAAAQFHLMGERVIHAWMIAHEPVYERYSPGLLLFQDILRWMDGSPYRRLDLGYGDYRFKRELSNAQAQLTHGFVGLPSAATLMREAAYALRQTAEQLRLGGVSELPGKAMRRLDLIRGLR